MIKHIDIFFLYLLCSFIGFVLVWKFESDLFVILPKVLVVFSSILFIKYFARLINNPLGQFYVFCFVIFLVYYTVFGFFHPTRSLISIYKPLIINVLFNFLLGFTLVCLINTISQRRKNLYISSVFIVLLFALLVVSTTGEPYYVSDHRNDLYQTLSDYMLRLVIFCTLLLTLKKNSNNNQYIYILVFWVLAFFVSLISGAKKHLAIEVPMILIVLHYMSLRIFIQLKLLAFIVCASVIAYIFKYSNLMYGLASITIGGMSFEKIGSYIERSIVDRIKIIQENFLNYMEVSYYIGNPWVNELVGENYVHSSFLSLLTSFGIFFGPLITILITYTILSFSYNESRFGILGYLILGVSFIATFFDWMLLWFILGAIVAYYKSQPKSSWNRHNVSKKIKFRKV